MALTYLGSLPVSGINLGLQASLGALTIEIAQLEVDLAGIVPAIAGQAQLAVDVPNVPAFAANLAVVVNPVQVVIEVAPGSVTLNGIETAGDLTLELGLVEAKLEAALEITVPLELGLAAGSIAGWSWSGGARAFGEAMREATRAGFGDIGPAELVLATLIATEDPLGWAGLSSGVQTGSGASGLHYLGQLGASEWSLGLGTLMVRIRAFVAKLEALKARIEYQLSILGGLELPSASAIIATGAGVVADLGLDGLLDNLINVNVDLQASIDGIQARIDVIVDLQAELSASLSAGGLSAWSYSGTAEALGSDLLSAILDGVPGGSGATATVSGLVLAARPPVMSAFGSIFCVE